jgi:hypothetical protein
MSIPALLHVLKHGQVKQSHKLILVELANHANEMGLAWPSIATVAEATGYTTRWVKTVLEDLVQADAIARAKVGRSYQYRLHLYDSKHKTCTCEVTSPLEGDADGQVNLRPEQVQLLPGYVQLLPQQVNSSAHNASRHNGNPTDPVFDPDLEPVFDPRREGVQSHTTDETRRSCRRGEVCGIIHQEGLCGVNAWEVA